MDRAVLHKTLVTVRNRKGLHARASAKFVKCAEQFDAEIFVTRDDQRVNGTSIMGLLMLAAGPGVTLLLEAEGSDAESAVATLVELISTGFGEGCVDED
ncbi:MAG: HPr family phosphocarrier protein [Hyphomicrobiaceae bacterium]